MRSVGRCVAFRSCRRRAKYGSPTHLCNKHAGDGSYTTVVALVRAPTDAKACRVIKRAWQIKSEAPWRFCREYKISDGPPTGRFPVPAWSVELGRWPWKMEAA